MKVLAVAPWVPSKRRPRSLGLISSLAESNDVRLVASTWNADDESDLKALPFDSIGIPMNRPRAVLRALRAVFGTRPLQQAYLDSPAMKSAIERQAREFEPDIIYFNTLRSAHWRCALPDGAAARVIDLDEFRSDYYRQISETARNLIWRWVARTESARMRSEEAQIIQDFRSVMVSSPTDVHMAANVTLVRSPHALKQAREAPPRSAHPSIVFVGRMSYGANIDAIRWFCRHAFPAIQQAIPDVTLDIVGDAPSRKVKALESDSIRVRGRVESVDEHYQSAWVSIVPVTSATGVQMKLIESLDLGTPVVTTPLVAAQAGVRDGVEVVIASDPRDWSTRVVDLLRSETNRHRLSARGQEWANDHYSMSRIRRDLNSAVLSARQA